jgi:tetratricopeptide (TPR) repeat protein
VVLFLLPGPVFLAAQQRQPAPPWWYTLEQGKHLFRSGEYGDALIAFEDARRERRAMYTRMEQDFIVLLSIPEVRRMGDSLELIENYIAESYQISAAAVLRELYYRVPRASLNGSAYRVLTELDRLKAYPEAEYWLGETYRAEGELGVALSQFEKAYGQRSLLESPGFEVEILYKIIDIHRQRQNFTEMERRAKEILERDSLWSADDSSFMRKAMAQTLRNEGVARFLTLYRYHNPTVERAHRLLGLYYYASGRHYLAEEHLMFSFLIQHTVLIEELIRSRFDYAFTGLEGLAAETAGRGALFSYMETVEYYKTIYYFAGALYGADRPLPAGQLWRFLSAQTTAREWQGRAQSQLASPRVAPPVEKVLEIP